MAEPLRLLPCFQQPGDWQMALDALLLSQRRPALRLYRWGGRPTLSLGLHQRPLESHWLALAQAGRLNLVRRPSGGRAVLHGGDLSYALVWPDAPGCRRQAYLEACAWLQLAFGRMGLPLQFGHQRWGAEGMSAGVTRSWAAIPDAGEPDRQIAVAAGCRCFFFTFIGRQFDLALRKQPEPC